MACLVGVSFNNIPFQLFLGFFRLLFLMKIFLYCENGEPIVIFCLIGATPTEFISPKSKTTFLYSRPERRQRKKERVKGLKSLLALSARSYQNFLEEIAVISPQLWVIVVMCLLKVWPWWHDWNVFIFVTKARWGLACTSEKNMGPTVSWYSINKTLGGKFFL